ncbi:hypothetical protein [Rugosimonospora africana]|uniref:Uncharacterized protein n=1 Tax=Rugosimonospora africana TaxID=556532 RepID=A0A8J3R3H5_9ACTN|nr:hypothetical protein [Rugosimonospora africana]GIH21038.1 hypothetical protein Raf01_92100 [Rugosimonospora africana]
MGETAGNGFRAQTGQLSDASKKLDMFSDDLGQVRGDVGVTPPSAAFGQLPESDELAQALAHSVQLSTDALGYAATVATNLGSGLACCAQNYAELDSTHAGNITAVLAR